MEKPKPPLTITDVLEAKIRFTVQETKKCYYRTKKYAKHITRAHIREPKEKAIHEYFLPDGRRWRKVTEEEYKSATSNEARTKLYEQLRKELTERVERIIRAE